MSTDGDKTTEEILNRTKLRSREIEELLGESSKSVETTIDSDVRKTECNTSITTSADKAEPLRALTNVSPDKQRSMCRRSKFAALAAELDQFEYDSPERKHKKESLLKGPPKRVSMGGETRASVLFAPAGIPTAEKCSPIDKAPTPYLPTNSNTFPFAEEEEVQHISPAAEEKKPDSIIVEEWDESPKHFASSSAKPMSPGDSEHQMSDRRSRFAALSATVDEFECDFPVEKRPLLLEDAGIKKPAVQKEMIIKKPSPVKTTEEPKNLTEEVVQKQEEVAAPIFKKKSVPPHTGASRVQQIQTMFNQQSSSCSRVEKPIPTSVKALRDRWEVLSAGETPPNRSSETPKCHKYAAKTSSTTSTPPIMQLDKTPEASKVTVKSQKILSDSTTSPVKGIEVSSKLDDVIQRGQPAFEMEEKQQEYAPLVNQCVDKTSQGSCDYRPITPNSEIIGSLMDDINSDLEKYRTPRGQQAVVSNDFNSDSADDINLTHTISFYRRQAKRAQIPESMMDKSDCTMSKKANMEASTSFAVGSPSYEPSDQINNEATLKRLNEAVIVQQDQICQASRALSFCRQNTAFRGSREEVDAQRALLIATERRRAILLEKDRILKSEYPVLNHTLEPRGTLTFSEIQLKISRDFINMYVRQHSECNHYYFIVLIKHGENVLHTTLASSEQGVKSGFIEFSDYIRLSGLTTGFVCTLEIFGLRCSPDAGGTEKSKKMSTWKKMVGTPAGSSSSCNTSMTFSGSSSRPMGVMYPGFQKVGFVSLNRSMLGRQKFHLVEPSYPLDGELRLNICCFAEEMESLDYRGFLSLYQLVSGLGSWTRFWCVLGNGQMRFWKYPEDEENKAPSVILDVVKCLSEVVDVPPSVASLQHSMQVDIALGDDDVPQEEIRMLLAADTHESKLTWMVAINTAIRNANVWSGANRK